MHNWWFSSLCPECRYVDHVLVGEREKMRCCDIEYKYPVQSSQTFVYGGILLAGFLVYFVVIFFSSPPGRWYLKVQIHILGTRNHRIFWRLSYSCMSQRKKYHGYVLGNEENRNIIPAVYSQQKLYLLCSCLLGIRTLWLEIKGKGRNICLVFTKEGSKPN